MKTRILALSGLVLVAALSRLLPHPPNFSPILSIAIFGGATFPSRRLALLIPLSAMFLSDLVIGFHGLIPLIYLLFMLMTWMGRRLQSDRTIGRIGSTVLTGSLGFFFISNLGVWAFESLYPRTLEGLVACFIAAIPFLHHQLIGDLLYSTLLFGALALAGRKIEALRPLSATGGQ